MVSSNIKTKTIFDAQSTVGCYVRTALDNVSLSLGAKFAATALNCLINFIPAVGRYQNGSMVTRTKRLSFNVTKFAFVGKMERRPRTDDCSFGGGTNLHRFLGRLV